MLTLLYCRHPVVAITSCTTSPGRPNPLDCFDLLKARQLRMSILSLGFSLTTGLNGCDPYR
jgi:hypothetical protein